MAVRPGEDAFDGTGTVTRGSNIGSAVAMVHMPLIYSLYEQPSALTKNSYIIRGSSS